MSTVASYACTALLGTNKQGILTPDENGYYELVLGAVNYHNFSGAFYPFDNDAKKLFESSSSLMRRINDGALYGELGHPRKQPGMSMRDYIGRILEVDEKHVCCHIKEVRLDSERIKDAKGQRVLAVVGKVKPDGPFGYVLEERLKNTDSNVCFSVRSLTQDKMVGGTLHKHLKTIVCWDMVNEPGIQVAKRWHAPGLESIAGNEEIEAVDEQQLTLDPQIITSLRDERLRDGVSLESGSGVSVEQVIDDLGLAKEPGVVKPASCKW